MSPFVLQIRGRQSLEFKSPCLSTICLFFLNSHCSCHFTLYGPLLYRLSSNYEGIKPLSLFKIPPLQNRPCPFFCRSLHTSPSRAPCLTRFRDFNLIRTVQTSSRFSEATDLLRLPLHPPSFLINSSSSQSTSSWNYPPSHSVILEIATTRPSTIQYVLRRYSHMCLVED